MRKAEAILLSEDAPKGLNVTLVTLENGDHNTLFPGHGERNLRLHNAVNSG